MGVDIYKSVRKELPLSIDYLICIGLRSFWEYCSDLLSINQQSNGTNLSILYQTDILYPDFHFCSTPFSSSFKASVLSAVASMPPFEKLLPWGSRISSSEIWAPTR